MAKPRSIPSAPNSKATLWVWGLGGMEVVFEVLDHTIARIPINPQEGVVIPNTIEALSELFLWEPSHRIFRGKGFYRPLLALDVALDVSP